MKKASILISTTLLLILLSACNKMFFSPTHMVQLEVETIGLDENRKNEAIHNIQNRLISLGASNVSVVSEKEHVLTLSYRGDFTEELLQRCFSTTGNLEFFEVFTPRKPIMDYFFEKYPTAFEEGNIATNDTVSNKDVLEFIESVNILTGSDEYGVLGYVAAENKERLERTSVYKTPIFISSIKKRVKFLFGKGYEDESYLLYTVLLNSANGAALGGQYITNASTGKSNYNDGYVVDLQMNEEGAIIWERLTEKVHVEQGYIAVVVDDFVYSAPSVTGGAIKGGNSQISGGLTKEAAVVLTSALQSGVIPKVKILKIIEL